MLDVGEQVVQKDPHAAGRRAGEPAIVREADQRAVTGGRELKAIIERFNASAALRTCQRCGAVLSVPAGAS